MQGRINYLNTDFLAAIKYVCDVSERFKYTDYNKFNNR